MRNTETTRIKKYVFGAAFYVCQSSIAKLNVSRVPTEHDPVGWSTQHAYFSRDNRGAVETVGRRIIALSSLIESQNPSGSATRPREVPSNAPCGHFPQGTR